MLLYIIDFFGQILYMLDWWRYFTSCISKYIVLYLYTSIKGMSSKLGYRLRKHILPAKYMWKKKLGNNCLCGAYSNLTAIVCILLILLDKWLQTLEQLNIINWGSLFCLIPWGYYFCFMTMLILRCLLTRFLIFFFFPSLGAHIQNAECRSPVPAVTGMAYVSGWIVTYGWCIWFIVQSPCC